MTVLRYNRIRAADAGAFAVSGATVNLAKGGGASEIDPALSTPYALSLFVWSTTKVRLVWKRLQGATAGTGWRVTRSFDSTDGVNGSWTDITSALTIVTFQPQGTAWVDHGTWFRAFDLSTVGNGTERKVWYCVEEQSALGYSPRHSRSVYVPIDNYTPVLPQATVDTTYSLPVGGTTWNCTTAAEIKTAFANYSPGDVIKIAAGTYDATPSLGFTLSAKANPSNKWTYVMATDAFQAQVPPETRVNLTDDAALMPVLLTNNGSAPALQLANNASYIRFVGLHFATKSTITYGYNVVILGDLSTSTAQTDLPHHIIMDRCIVRPHAAYMPGDSTTVQMQRGVQAQCYSDFAFIDGWVDEVKFSGGDNGSGIGMWAGYGPVKIHNNYLASNGTTFMCGGAANELWEGTLVEDITVTQNHLSKRVRWREAQNGTSVSFLGGAKNNFELKWGRRILFEGNVLDNYWMGAQISPVVFRSGRDFEGARAAWWTVLQDLTARNNLVSVSASPTIAILSDTYLPFETDWTEIEHTRRVLVKNWAFEDTPSTSMLAGGGSINPAVRVAQVSNFGTFVTFDHLAAYSSTDTNVPNRSIDLTSGGGTPGPATGGLRVTNSIIFRGTYGLFDSTGDVPAPAEGINSLHKNTLNDDYDWHGIVYIYASNNQASLYPEPTHTSWVLSRDVVGFSATDYGLATDSAYKYAVWPHTTDGTDPGVDNSALQAAIVGVREAAP